MKTIVKTSHHSRKAQYEPHYPVLGVLLVEQGSYSGEFELVAQFRWFSTDSAPSTQVTTQLLGRKLPVFLTGEATRYTFPREVPVVHCDGNGWNSNSRYGEATLKITVT